MKRTDVPPREQVLQELSQWLMQTTGIRLLGSLGFENAYALAMKRQKAEELGIRGIADLAAHAGALTIASDYEFFARPEWKAMRAAYGLNFKSERTLQPEFMYKAVASGEADVISAYTSDGQIATEDLVVLEDVKHVIPPYDAILLVSPKRGMDEKLITALKPLIGTVDVKAMREANARASNGGTTPDAVAKKLLEQIGEK
jgi:osmoprotectant transport system permease protein